MDFYITVANYLKACGIKASKTYVRRKLESHSDYPSLVSLTDVLSELEIPYSAVLAEKENYLELSYPLLAHINIEKASDFVVVKNKNEFERSGSAILANWSGVVLIIPKRSKISSIEHRVALKKNRQDEMRLYAYLVFLGVLSIFSLLNNSLVQIMQWMFCVAGIAMCWIIASYSSGNKTIVSDLFCSSDSNSSCNKVISSSVAKWFGINLTDLGAVYFLSTTIFLSLGNSLGRQDPAMDTLLGCLFSCGLLFVLFSLFYQAFVVRVWCRMCLVVAAIVTALFILTVIKPGKLGLEYSNYSIKLFLFSITLAIPTWAFCKMYVLLSKALEDEKIKVLKWKCNPDIFLGFLKQRPQIQIDRWRDDIVLGDPNAPLKITAVCQAFCAPCAKAHLIIDNLLERFPTEVCVTVRFLDRSHPGQANPVKAILNASFNSKNAKTIVKYWFEWMDLDKFRKHYSDIDDDIQRYNEYALMMESWAKEISINHTPTIFINGYELYAPYDFEILPSVLPSVLERLSNSPQSFDHLTIIN